jgi:hypothetical protein
LPAPCETPDTAISSKPRTRAINSELESEYDDAIFGDGDTDVESNEEEVLPIQNLSKQRQKMTVEKVLNTQAWPADTHITLQPDGKLSLKAQKPPIRAVFHLAFVHLYAKLLFENAFPGASEHVQFSRDALYTAAKDLKHKNMYQRLRSDLNYTEILGKIVSVSNNTCSSV